MTDAHPQSVNLSDPSSHCVACGALASLTLAPSENPMPGELDYRWDVCSSCGTHSAFPRRAMDYAEVYSSIDTYSTAFADLAGAVESTKNCAYGQWYNRCLAYGLLQRTQRSGKFLDVGAGTGFMLALAKELGFEVSGVDISKQSREFIEANVQGATMKAGLEDVGDSFSHIVALEVLEHVEEPLGLLGVLKQKLSSDGYLILSVPNAERLNFRFPREGAEREVIWKVGGAGDAPPHHLTRFTKAGLLEILKRAGFQDIHVGFTPLDLTTSLLHSLGTSPFFKFKFAGKEIGFPILWLSHFFNKEIANRLFALDPSLGHGLVAVASPTRREGSNLSQLFEDVVQAVIASNLKFHDRDLIRHVYDNKRGVVSSLLSRFR